MNNRIYNTVLVLSALICIAGLVVVFNMANAAFQAFGATLAGAGCSLFISTVLQRWASDEQSHLIRDLTLRTEGVKALPREFLELN